MAYEFVFYSTSNRANKLKGALSDGWREYDIFAVDHFSNGHDIRSLEFACPRFPKHTHLCLVVSRSADTIHGQS